MDRKVGMAAVLLAAGVLSKVSPQGESPRGLAVRPLAGTTPSVASVAGQETSEAGPWTPLCRYAGATEKSSKPAATVQVRVEKKSGTESGTIDIQATPKDPEPKDEDRFCLASFKDAKWRFRTLIATVPDPELTHLSLVADRYIESIVWAVSDGGKDDRYSFDSYWFPWHPETHEETDAARRAAAEADRQKRVSTPGTLLFRKLGDPYQLMVVFLVGETPTSGINPVAFGKAWRYSNIFVGKTVALPICKEACKGILGPSFTGSIPSLDRLLSQYATEPRTEVVVVSGSVTEADKDTFVQSKAHFCTTIAPGRRIRAAMEKFLRERAHWGFDWSTVAYLLEDDTGYAQNFGSGSSGDEQPPRKPLSMRFPRGIARIRNSTDEATPSAAPQPGLNYAPLPLVLHDSGQDSIPSFSPKQSPLSQEAVVVELAATMRREGIRYAGIVATDPLDQVFLARAIQRLTPNIRIILFDSDLLFNGAAQSWGLHGILSFTSYPLISRNQNFDRAKQPSRTQFASQVAEGEYNACRRLLLPTSGDPDGCDAAELQPGFDYLLDYVDPFAVRGHVHQPSVWVTVLGRNSWWPVAAYPADSSHPLLQGSWPEAHPDERFSAERSLRLWRLLFCVVCFGAALHVLLILLMNGNWNSRKELAKKRVPRLFASGWKPELETRRRLLLGVASLAVGSACGLLAAASAASGLGEAWIYVVSAGALSIAALGEAVWVLWPHRAKWAFAAAAAGIAVLLVLTATHSRTGHTLEFASYRALHLESGSSPLLPPLLLLLGICVFMWLRLLQLRISEERYSRLPDIGLNVPGQGIPGIDREQRWLILTAVSAWFLFFRPDGSLTTIEGRSYDYAMIVLTSAVIGLLAVAIVRLSATWTGLAKLLQELERHPIHEAFSRLPKDFDWTAIWTGYSRPNLSLPSRALDAIRLSPEGAKHAPAIQQSIDALGSSKKEFDGKHGLVTGLADGFEAAEKDVVKALQPKWDRGHSESLPKGDPGGKPLSDAERNRIVREEFLAIRFVSYILYVFTMMRAFLEFAMYGFILLVAALSAYPFEGRRQIEIAEVIIFVVLAGSAIVVFARMDRDPLLSRISETKRNELGMNFIYRVASYGALPLLTLLASQIPEVGNFLLSWVQPALQAVR